MKKRINVVGAVIVRDGRVLCAQRGPSGALPGAWEFPGGKVELNEPVQSALAREIKEELNCEITVGDLITTTAHEYDFGIVSLTTFYCQLVSGTPELTEHAAFVWSSPEALADFDWAPADVPAVKLIMEDLST